MVNPSLEDQKNITILTNIKKKFNIVKIKSFHLLHSEIGVGQFPQQHSSIILDTKRVQDETSHFLLECLAYVQIISQFQNICHGAKLLNLVSHHTFVTLECFS